MTVYPIIKSFNIRGGRLSAAEDNGRSYLKMPIGCFESREDPGA